MNLQEQVSRIQSMMGLVTESFDSGVEPELKHKNISKDKESYSYTLPSTKTDSQYLIDLTIYKNFENMKDVLEIDFSLSNDSAFWGITNLNEVFYILSSINFLLEKFKNKFKYLVIHSNESRLAVYQRALGKINYLEFVEKKNNMLIYKNKSKWSFF
jgi:hypothetical protein